MWHTIRAELEVPLAQEETFSFFSKAENLQRITPDSLDFQILTPGPIEMREDTVIDYRIKSMGLPMRWRTLITVWDPPQQFVDEQIKGPYQTWIHRHSFIPLAEDRTLIRDYVRYELPLTPLGEITHPIIRAQLNGIFRFRDEETPKLICPGKEDQCIKRTFPDERPHRVAWDKA